MCDWVWATSLSNVLKGDSGCPKCAGHVAPNTDEIVNVFRSNGHDADHIGGRYNNSKSKLKFRCNRCAFIWELSWGSISRGSGCPSCSGKRRWTPLLVDAVLAETCREVSLLDRDKVSTSRPSRWKCNVCDHEWKTSVSHIINGSGCPECNSLGIIEREIREFLSSVFGLPFKKVKPEWLINPSTGSRLEFDCFCSELKLAIEIDGAQHDTVSPYLGVGVKELLGIQSRDRLKEGLAAANGITLLRLKTKNKKRPVIPAHLKKMISAAGIAIPESWDLTRFPLNKKTEKKK